LKGSAVSPSRQGKSRQPDKQRRIEALGLALQQYQRSVQAFDDAVGRRLGLGPADLRCLDWLADGPKTAGQLSFATGLKPAATTALIDRLSRKGYVRRIRPEADRRTVVVEMTELGQQRTWECYGPLVAAGQPSLEALSDEQLEFMADYLDQIRELTDAYRTRLGVE
jgi:DNA-binding MarR family transcriptional regulator